MSTPAAGTRLKNPTRWRSIASRRNPMIDAAESISGLFLKARSSRLHTAFAL
jgi:hypothetical protein